jgi:hypothetical protein
MCIQKNISDLTLFILPCRIYKNMEHPDEGDGGIGNGGAESCEELEASSSLVIHGTCAPFDEVAVDFACRLFLF